MNTIHIIGAGVAGLSAATYLATHSTHRIRLYEAAGLAGGRCRSFHDALLGYEIDNGNHLIVGANRHTFDYLARIESTSSMISPDGGMAFCDVKNGARWRIKPPFYLPRLSLTEYLPLIKCLLLPQGKKTISKSFSIRSRLSRRYIHPVAIAMLNTPVEKASSAMFSHVLWHIIKAGKRGAKPYVPKHSLQASFINPALEMLKAQGHEIYYHDRLKAMSADHLYASELHFTRMNISLQSGDQIILATPASVSKELLPKLQVPDEYHSIINGHYKIEHDFAVGDIIGVVGGCAEWIFIKEGIISTTISAADHLLNMDTETLAKTMWSDIQTALKLDAPMPAHRIIIEKRATFSASFAQLASRPSKRTHYDNVWLAGDYTQTHLPATIEGAILSGVKAAIAALKKANEAAI